MKDDFCPVCMKKYSKHEHGNTFVEAPEPKFNDKIKIGVGLCFYKDLASLKRGLPTYAPFVDHVFAIDGRFSYFSGDDYSEPETIDYLNSFDNLIYERFIGMEHDKRQRYVDLAAKHGCNFLLIIDSDEYVLQADWDLFKENAVEISKAYPGDNFLGVLVRYTPEGFIPEEFSNYPKLWARPEECEYYKAHCIFKNKNYGGVVRSSSNCPTVGGIRLDWNDKLRTTEYLKGIHDYQQRMLSYEVPIRERLRL